MTTTTARSESRRGCTCPCRLTGRKIGTSAIGARQRPRPVRDADPAPLTLLVRLRLPEVDSQAVAYELHVRDVEGDQLSGGSRRQSRPEAAPGRGARAAGRRRRPPSAGSPRSAPVPSRAGPYPSCGGCRATPRAPPPPGSAARVHTPAGVVFMERHYARGGDGCRHPRPLLRRYRPDRRGRRGSGRLRASGRLSCGPAGRRSVGFGGKEPGGAQSLPPPPEALLNPDRLGMVGVRLGPQRVRPDIRHVERKALSPMGDLASNC